VQLPQVNEPLRRMPPCLISPHDRLGNRLFHGTGNQ
jgi:hypothetical protein